jgi:hypothetical protein
VSAYLHAPAASPRGKRPSYSLDRKLVGPRGGPDAVEKRRIPNPRQESNPRTPIVHPVAICACVYVRVCACVYKVKLSLSLTKYHAMNTYWGVEVYLRAFLTSALDGGEWSASRPGRFTPQGKSPRYPLDRRLGGPQILSVLINELPWGLASKLVLEFGKST